MTRYERTGWRDQAISARHREWGFNCPAVDLDWLMVEYNLGEPVALVEYKHYLASAPSLMHPTYRALAALAQKAAVPFLIAYYWPDLWAFRVAPVTPLAVDLFPVSDLSEVEYVAKLYEARRLAIDAHVLRRLHRHKPPRDDRETA